MPRPTDGALEYAIYPLARPDLEHLELASGGRIGQHNRSNWLLNTFEYQPVVHRLEVFYVVVHHFPFKLDSFALPFSKPKLFALALIRCVNGLELP